MHRLAHEKEYGRLHKAVTEAEEYVGLVPGLDSELQEAQKRLLELRASAKAVAIEEHTDEYVERITIATEKMSITNAKPSAAADNVAEEDNTPDAICCPITQEIMIDPVFLVGDGHTYEREAITTWLEQNNTSPLTNEILPDCTLIANHVVKKMVAEWRAP